MLEIRHLSTQHSCQILCRFYESNDSTILSVHDQLVGLKLGSPAYLWCNLAGVQITNYKNLLLTLGWVELESWKNSSGSPITTLCLPCTSEAKLARENTKGVFRYDSVFGGTALSEGSHCCGARSSPTVETAKERDALVERLKKNSLPYRHIGLYTHGGVPLPAGKAVRVPIKKRLLPVFIRKLREEGLRPCAVMPDNPNANFSVVSLIAARYNGRYYYVQE